MSRSLRRRVCALESVTEFERPASSYDPDVLCRMTDDELIEVWEFEQALQCGETTSDARARVDEIIELAVARNLVE